MIIYVKFSIKSNNNFHFPFSPPVISGSHTLQHPNKNKHHEGVIPPHIHQNQMRQMAMGAGTQTLGRHHHSPSHMRQNSGK